MRTRALTIMVLAVGLACSRAAEAPARASAEVPALRAEKHAADAAIAALEDRIADAHDDAKLPALVDELATQVARAEAAVAALAAIGHAEPPPGDARVHALLARLDADAYALPPAFAARVLAQVAELEQAPAKPDEQAARARVWPTITAELTALGLPEELAYVAYAESRWDPHARSPADSVGLWQLRRSTATRLGLRIDAQVDEREGVASSTRAAARLIADLAGEFDADALLLGLVAYQLGEGRARGLVEEAGRAPGGWRRARQGFWALYRMRRLPDEVGAYLPKVLAAAIVRR